MHTKALLALLLCGGMVVAWLSGSDPSAPTATALSNTALSTTALSNTALSTTALSTTALSTRRPVLADLAQSPPRPLEPAPARTRLVVSGAGDTNLDPVYIPALRSKGYDYAFTGLQDMFHRDDLSIVNFECAASTRKATRVPKEFNFNCDVNALPAMKAAGVDVANIANNHGGDFGPDALLDTRTNLLAAGLAPVGVGHNSAEANTAARFERNGWKVAVLGFDGVIPTPDWIAGTNRPGMASGDDTVSMVAAIKAAHRNADLVIVVIHWGVELDTRPRPDDVERAHAMIDAGADMIFGHHSHRLNPLEYYKGRPIAWSLGNFVWPRMSEAGSATAIAQVVVEPDGSMTACLVPVEIESDAHPVVQVRYQGDCRW